MTSKQVGGYWQNLGTAAGDLMYPNKQGIRGELKRKGIKPRNHHLDNIRRIKYTQKENRIEKEISKNKPEPFRMKKFKNVESRVFNTGSLTTLKKTQSPEKEDLPPHLQGRGKVQKVRTPRIIDPNDAISRNRRKVSNISEAKRRQRNTNNKKSSTHKAGAIPKYLKDRKKKWKDEEDMKKARRRKRRECPPGMILMKENDRLDTLKTLEKNKSDICFMIGKLPIICDTIGLRRKKGQLEKKLDEIENAVKLFSKKKVYIADDY